MSDVLQTAGAKKKPAAKKPAAKKPSAKKPAAKKPAAKKPAAKKPAAKKRVQKAGAIDDDVDYMVDEPEPMTPMTEAMREKEFESQQAMEELRGMTLNDPRYKMQIKNLDEKPKGRMGRLANIGDRLIEASDLMAMQNEAVAPRHEKFFEVHASDEDKLAKKMDVGKELRLPAPKRSFFGSRADKKPTKDDVARVLKHWFGRCVDILNNKNEVQKRALAEILMENRDRIIDGYLTGFLPTDEVKIRFELDVDSKRNPLLLNNIFDVTDDEADVFDMMLHQVKFAVKWSDVKKARTV